MNINDLKLRLHMWCKARYIHVRVDVTDMQKSFTYFLFKFTRKIVHQVVSHCNRAKREAIA
jgi:hypothetical protein